MDTMTKSWSVLVVDDHAEARGVLADRLVRAGFEPSYAEDGFEALGVFGRNPSDLILTDRRMPGLDGIGLVRRIREISDVPIIMITAFASVSDCEEAMRVGANRYLDYRRDLDRVGSVARELVGRAVCVPGPATSRAITATEVRLQAKLELQRELQSLLVECRGNIAEVARRMGKDRSTIRYHLRRLGMLNEQRPGRDESSAEFSGRLTNLVDPQAVIPDRGD